MPTRARTCVLLVHGDHHARAGLVARLSGSPAVTLTGDTTSAADALVALADRQPDVLVAEARLPDGRTGDVVRAVRASDNATAVVLLLDPDEPSEVADAIRSGADGIATAGTADASLVLAVRELGPDSCLLDRRAATSLASMCPPDAQTLLSRRESDVLECLGDDLTNAQIASRLFVSRETVKTHVAHLLRKLEVGSRRAAVERARLIGVLPPAPGPAAAASDDQSSTHCCASRSVPREHLTLLTPHSHLEGSPCEF